MDFNLLVTFFLTIASAASMCAQLMIEEEQMRVDAVERLSMQMRKRTTDLSDRLLEAARRCESNLEKILKLGTDDDYIGFFMIDRQSFESLHPHFQKQYLSRAIRRRGKRRRDQARRLYPERRAFNARLTLALTLRYMVGGIDTRTRQLEWAGKRWTIDRYINFGIECLNHALDSHPSGRVDLPTVDQMKRLSSAVQRRCTLKGIRLKALHGVWGFIDGTMHKSTRPTVNSVQLEYYNGYYGVCGYKAVYLVASDGNIVWARLRKGTEYDNAVHAGLNLTLHSLIPKGSNLKILGDSAFVPSAHLIRPYTTKEKNSLRDTLTDVESYNKQLSSIRIAAEWAVQDVKKFSIFRTKFSVYMRVDQESAWECGCRLHNFVTRMSRINQTFNVFGGSAFEYRRTA